MAESLLQKRMWVDVNDYDALHACVRNGAVDAARLLLDGGMDFERYRQEYVLAGHEETVRELEEHWQMIKGQDQKTAEPEIGGMTFG